MTFKESLRYARTQAKMTQVELAKAVGVTDRTIQNYEMGARKPRDYEIVEKLAGALGISVTDLMGKADLYIMQAAEKGGTKAAKDVDALVSEITGLFAGGQISEDSMDGAMKALYDAYWIAKEKNKKYIPKKYRSPEHC